MDHRPLILLTAQFGANSFCRTCGPARLSEDPLPRGKRNMCGIVVFPIAGVGAGMFAPYACWLWLAWFALLACFVCLSAAACGLPRAYIAIWPRHGEPSRYPNSEHEGHGRPPWAPEFSSRGALSFCPFKAKLLTLGAWWFWAVLGGFGSIKVPTVKPLC